MLVVVVANLKRFTKYSICERVCSLGWGVGGVEQEVLMWLPVRATILRLPSTRENYFGFGCNVPDH